MPSTSFLLYLNQVDRWPTIDRPLNVVCFAHLSPPPFSQLLKGLSLLRDGGAWPTPFCSFILLAALHMFSRANMQRENRAQQCLEAEIRNSTAWSEVGAASSRPSQVEVRAAACITTTLMHTHWYFPTSSPHVIMEPVCCLFAVFPLCSFTPCIDLYWPGRKGGFVQPF